MRSSIAVLAALIAVSPLLAAPVSGQTPTRPDRQQMEAMQQRRAQLEQQVRRQFLAQVAERLALEEHQRARLEQVLDQGARERRALAHESAQLRVQLIRAVAEEDATLATYQELLDRRQELGGREQALERREAAALAEFLDARQQAQFLVLRMQLTERVRGMRGQGPGGGPPGDRPRDRRRWPGGQ